MRQIAYGYSTERYNVRARGSPPSVPKAKPSAQERLADPAFRDKLLAAIVQLGGIKPAARKLGIPPFQIWLAAKDNAELSDALWAARQTVAEQCYDECLEIADGDDDPRNKHIRIDARMRVAGKLLHLKYGDKPSTEVNVVTQVGMVCDEATRKRLIEMRERLMPAPAPTAVESRNVNTSRIEVE